MFGILGLVSDASSHDPDGLAVMCADGVITRAELDRRANRLARHLRALGAGRATCVAACTDRGIALPVAMLGIMRAGAAYVPLDPDHPAERHALVIADTAAQIVVTQTHLARLFDKLPVALICADGEPVGSELPERFDSDIAPGDLAYVIYTSGSTGRPKGVAIEHGAFAARHPISPYHVFLRRGDVLAAVTAATWNPSLFEVLYTLAAGATIALPDAETLRDPRRLARFLDAHGVTFMRAVPSLWQALLDCGWRGRPELVIVCHGEPLDPRLEERLRAAGRSVSNTYGATEASVFSVVETNGGERRLVPLVAGSS